MTLRQLLCCTQRLERVAFPYGASYPACCTGGGASVRGGAIPSANHVFTLFIPTREGV